MAKKQLPEAVKSLLLSSVREDYDIAWEVIEGQDIPYNTVIEFIMEENAKLQVKMELDIKNKKTTGYWNRFSWHIETGRFTSPYVPLPSTTTGTYGTTTNISGWRQGMFVRNVTRATTPQSQGTLPINLVKKHKKSWVGKVLRRKKGG